MENGFINDESMEYLKNLSDDDKKWVLLFLCFLLAGEEGIKKIVDIIKKEKGERVIFRQEASMKKVKIEIDMPECCGECPCGHFDDRSSWCGLLNYYDKRNIIDEYSGKGKPNWCPLLTNIENQ